MQILWLEWKCPISILAGTRKTEDGFLYSFVLVVISKLNWTNTNPEIKPFCRSKRFHKWQHPHLHFCKNTSLGCCLQRKKLNWEQTGSQLRKQNVFKSWLKKHFLWPLISKPECRGPSTTSGNFFVRSVMLLVNFSKFQVFSLTCSNLILSRFSKTTFDDMTLETERRVHQSIRGLRRNKTRSCRQRKWARLRRKCRRRRRRSWFRPIRSSPDPTRSATATPTKSRTRGASPKSPGSLASRTSRPPRSESGMESLGPPVTWVGHFSINLRGQVCGFLC